MQSDDQMAAKLRINLVKTVTMAKRMFVKMVRKCIMLYELIVEIALYGANSS